jgi:hypothetical protein
VHSAGFRWPNRQKKKKKEEEEEEERTELLSTTPWRSQDEDSILCGCHAVLLGGLRGVEDEDTTIF